MPDFAANLSTMFTELPFMQRFDAAARCGFSGVELTYLEAVAEKDLARRLRECDLTLVAFNLPAGKSEQGERGIACDPARIQEFREGARRAIDYAAAVGCRLLNCLAGSLPEDDDNATASRTVVENLRFAAGQALAAGITILVEPVPGSYLYGTAQAVALLDTVAARNVALLYDVFQMHAMGEAVGPTIARHLARIGHIQVAGWPDRAEPIAGEIKYQQLLGFIDRIGYRGWVGCEYFPRAGTEAGLGWMSRHKALTSKNPCRWGIPLQALPPSMSAVAIS
jgi:hydroxypyruvate isomerase